MESQAPSSLPVKEEPLPGNRKSRRNKRPNADRTSSAVADVADGQNPPGSAVLEVAAKKPKKEKEIEVENPAKSDPYILVHDDDEELKASLSAVKAELNEEASTSTEDDKKAGSAMAEIVVSNAGEVPNVEWTKEDSIHAIRLTENLTELRLRVRLPSLVLTRLPSLVLMETSRTNR